MTRSKFNRQKENNCIVNYAVDEMLLQENNKVSTENIESELDGNDLYHIYNMSLDNKKENT